MTDVDAEELSPAERLSAARRRNAEAGTPLGRFRTRYSFDLDPFQIQACTALQEGRGVLVAAPTGSGKTVVGEFAVELALETGRKAFYTTPIKALSNQKYADLVRRHGPDSVGLLTGDNTVNGEAPVVVMTTEVLRNMLYAGSSTLQGLGYVVMDEVHYLADRFRGAVWEEVIIHLPDDVLVVSLSATVSNAEEFGAWLDTVRGDTAVVVSEHRPVPLWQHVLVGRQVHDLFTTRSGDPLSETAMLGSGPDPGDVTVNPELRRLARDERERGSGRGDRGYRGRGGRGPQNGRRGVPSRAEVISTLDGAGLLPAITFIFSRAGCEQAVQQCLTWGVRLTTTQEREEIRRIVDTRCVDIPDQDLGILGYWEWTEALGRGIAAHHAGLLPAFKEVVEELFTRGLIKAVFATETLALGINMPARSVVLEKLVKWNGQSHADITPGEYTQLTGRAGRRGIDVEGHAVVVWHQGIDPDAVGGLASTRTYPLRSSFRPTYNMAVNLVGQVGRTQAREILETSFAQFQADRAVVGLATQLRKQEEALEGYAEAMRCHLGDFTEYAGLRQQISEREAGLARGSRQEKRLDTLSSLERLRRGDVIHLPGGRKAGWAVVIESGGPPAADGPRLTVLTTERQVRRITLADVRAPIEAAARVPIPKTFTARSPQARRDLASTLRNALGDIGEAEAAPPGQRRTARRGSAVTDDERLSALRRAMRAHPCHGCSDREDHARWAERWFRLDRERAQLARRIEGRTNTIARTFDRVCELLTERGYLVGDTVTPYGERLRRLYAESDLLVAECLREGVWDGLDGAQLAACVSALVYEARREEGLHPRLPGGLAAAAMTETVRVWSALDDRERELKLQPTPEPDAGLAWAIHRWATGARLEDVLADTDLAAGDFVRWCKQVIDLLGQIQIAEQTGSRRAAGGAASGGVPRHSLAHVAADAIERIRRGVVAYSSVV